MAVTWFGQAPLVGSPDQIRRRQQRRRSPITAAQTEGNKALVKDMLESCLFPGARPDRIEDYFAEDYLQHNPNVGDGLAIVRKLAHGKDRTLVYNEIVRMVGRGNFVATLCRATSRGIAVAQVDIMRVENGKIVEHWDNVERVVENELDPSVERRR